MSDCLEDHFHDLIAHWRKGDLSACDLLVDLYYAQLVRGAQRLLCRIPLKARSLEPTDLVHEIYVPLRKQTNLNFHSSRHFINRALHLMRFALNDHKKHDQAGKRGHAYEEVPWCKLNTDR